MGKDMKRKAPSRVRYEKSHPIICCRITKEVYDRVQEVKDKEGKSFGDVLKQGQRGWSKHVVLFSQENIVKQNNEYPSVSCSNKCITRNGRHANHRDDFKIIPMSLFERGLTVYWYLYIV